MYFLAPISLFISSPFSKDTGVRFFSASFASIPGSSRRSIFVPTRMIGIAVMSMACWALSSAYHLDLTFSYEAGESIENAIRNTSVCAPHPGGV